MKNVHDIDLNLLKIFARIFECGSVSSAAKEIGLSQSALSHALSRLREQVQDPLFVRQGKSLVATEVATRLYPRVQKALNTLELGLRESISFDPAVSTATFTLAVTDYVEAVLLPKIGKALVKDAPNVKVRLSELHERDLSTSARTWDFMIARLDRELPDDFYAQALWREEFVTVCAENHPRLKGDAITLEEFVAEKHVVVGTGNTGLSAVDLALQQLGLRRHIQLVTAFFASSPRMAASSEMIATIPKRLAVLAAQEMSLRVFQVPLDIAPFSVSLAWGPRRHSDPAHKWFRTWLQKMANT